MNLKIQKYMTKFKKKIQRILIVLAFKSHNLDFINLLIFRLRLLKYGHQISSIISSTYRTI